MKTAGPAIRSIFARRLDPARAGLIVDVLAAALAASLPWSTSATGILAALWLLSFLGTVDREPLWRAIRSPAGALPILLVLLLVLGTIWAFDVPPLERWGGIRGLAKLLVIPLLMAHFQISERGDWVLRAFLGSCVILLFVSWSLVLAPFAPNWGRTPGVPAKDYIAQANEFTVCAFILMPIALIELRQKHYWKTAGAVLIAVAFLINVLVVATSRTALVVVPALLVLFACKYYSRRAMAIVLIASGLAAVLAWSFAPTVRRNINTLATEIMTFDSAAKVSTRAGERLEFWRKSASFFAEAPLIGHGTGSVPLQFRRAAVGQTGMAAIASENPHNQTLAIAIQLGLLGVGVLFAMWIVHLMTFWRDGLVGWVGLVVVMQNIVSSLFNSHLADFTQGWGYVIGVGVAAGMVLKERAHSAARPSPVT